MQLDPTPTIFWTGIKPWSDYIHPLDMGPILFLLLLAWIVYGFWVRGLFRPPAQWNPAQMVRRCLYFCLLSITFISWKFLDAVAFSQAVGPSLGVGLLDFAGGALFHMLVFAAQLILYVALLWWRTRSKISPNSHA